MVRLDELGTRCCKWSIGQDVDGHFFCGEPTEFRKAFCAKHRAEGETPRIVPLDIYVRNMERFVRTTASRRRGLEW